MVLRILVKLNIKTILHVCLKEKLAWDIITLELEAHILYVLV